jgi:hypothetical protein
MGRKKVKNKKHKNNKSFDIESKQNKSSTLEDTPRYPSSNLMLSEVKDIYNDEKDRNEKLENKSSIGIAFLGVLLTIGINELNIDKLIHAKINTLSNIVLNLILILALSVMVIKLVLSLYNFYQTIKTRSYKKMSTDGFLKENAECKEDTISMLLINTYVDIIKHNRKVNDEKSTFIDNGMKHLIICIVSYVIYALVYKFI